MAPLGFATVDVRDVHFDKWHRNAGQSIPNRKTRVAVRSSVHDSAVDTSAEPMNVLDELSFAVSLRELERCTKLTGDCVQAPFDVLQRLRTVDGWLADAEQIEVRTVYDGDPHVFFSPSSHALNCWMSSAWPPPASEAGWLSLADTSCCACCEKNWSNEKPDWLAFPAAGVA